MSGRICGHCTNWRCDESLHLKGHCIINRMDRFHGTMCDSCTKYQSMWEYTRPQGEWIVLVDEDNIQTCKCSICGRMVDIANHEFDKFPYCHCGAKMGGGKE